MNGPADFCYAAIMATINRRHLLLGGAAVAGGYAVFRSLPMAGAAEKFEVVRSDAEWRRTLTSDQYVVLRAHKISTAPLLIYAGAIWGVGMGGGYFLAFGHAAWVPASLRGAPGFWSAATAGLMTAAVALSGFLAWVHRQEAAELLPESAR